METVTLTSKSSSWQMTWLRQKHLNRNSAGLLKCKNVVNIILFFISYFRYDFDNSGAIDKGEMVNVMSAIYAMVDGNMKVGDIYHSTFPNMHKLI